MKHYMPTRILTGTGILQKHKKVFPELGKRCYIITSKSSGRLSGALDDLTAVLNEYSIGYDIYDRISQNPTVVSCIEAGKNANSFKADFIVGVGGGSVLDASKTAAVVAANPELTEELIYKQAWENKPVPLILIGTTAGTGSEVTYVSVMTNKDGIKKSIHNDDLYAVYTFGDPSYTISMPEHVRISTAIDALAHLLESYFNNSSSDLSRAFSLQGVRILYPKLQLLAKHQELNEEDRETVYNASILGGLAINITGTVFCHTLGYYFTEHYHLLHGFACALFTNELLDYEYNNHRDYCDAFFDVLQIDRSEMKELISSLLPETEIHLTEEEIQALLPRYTNNNSVKNTYGTMSVNDIEEILRRL
ncbi:MAG: iron-containing alcohol dehydrogenase [Erysipelotrichaceae bacterium]|nr:iron-containing alcohol dehydrogenase [Erysipelotrichaceae bacterium]